MSQSSGLYFEDILFVRFVQKIPSPCDKLNINVFLRGDRLYPDEYIQYLAHFHGDRDYFECHEILEEYWKSHDRGNKDSVWVGLIQLAVSCYHHRRSNFIGAKKTLEKAMKILNKEEQILSSLGLNNIEFFSLLNERYIVIEKNQPYTSFNFPINDPYLTKLCQTHCLILGFIWCSQSNLSNSSLVNRHKMRDRTNIINERLSVLKRNKGSE
jgi:predicted metal-dependent hydrolase